MLKNAFQNTFDGMRNEAKFLRMLVVGLALALVVVAFSSINRDQVVSVIPPTLTEQSWVSKTSAGSEYTEAWALYIGMMLGNVTPSNAGIVKDAIGPLLDQSIYQQTMDVLDEQIHSIRQDRVTLHFEPQKVLRDAANPNKFFVTGRATTQGPTGAKKRSNRTYEMELVIKNYKPSLTWLSTNSGDARTQDVVDRERAAAEQKAERDKRSKK